MLPMPDCSECEAYPDCGQRKLYHLSGHITYTDNICPSFILKKDSLFGTDAESVSKRKLAIMRNDERLRQINQEEEEGG